MLGSDLLDRTVEGYNIPVGARLGEVIGDDPAVLVFLRHHG